ncbi:MAG TPA: serine/threonine-protein kinase [Vicinamibacterales bacterium]|nr:serine/threonine-protein kinase [Vicinamibacterales bacterium]
MATGVLTPLPDDQPDNSAAASRRIPSEPATDADSLTIASTDLSGSVRSTANATGALRPGQAFGSRYNIIRSLGVGGMGAVYQAWDSELGVAVAIKVIRPDATRDALVAADIERRFKRELVLARQVTHKNVVRIYDLGEIDGIKYITMSYVDGADLATRLARDGPMQVTDVLRIARQVAAGLVEAHKAGVVHRDLKPGNIMIDRGGDALIMDFGIARSSGGPKQDPNVETMLPTGARQMPALDATLYGSVVGTVAYMAPEQASGQDVDQRADIYAFGLILYDMLVGRHRAQHSKSAVGELQARMQAAPPPVKSIVPGIPDALSQIISRCLEPDRDKRYATSSELARAIDRLDDNAIEIAEPARVTRGMAAAIVLLVAALVGGTWWFTRTPPPPKQHEPVAVLIADFDNTTGDPAFHHVLEPMIKRALEEATFISAHDRKGYRDFFAAAPPEKMDAVAARELAAKQGVSIVLAGSIGSDGSGYAIAMSAIETLTGNVIATLNDRAASKEQVVVTATKLAASVRQALGDDTSDAAQMFAMASVSAVSPEVLQNYAAARDASSNLKYDEARAFYTKAVELDPNFGIGYQGLAALARNQSRNDEAKKYVTEALRHLDRMTEREVYATRGLYYTLSGDYQQCEKEFGDLVRKYPVDVLAHNNLALCLTYVRNVPKALDEMKRAVELVPKRALFRINLALYANYAGDFATATGQEAILRELGRPQWALFNRALAQMGQGGLDEAATTYEELGKTDALGSSWMSSGLADLAIQQGRFSDAIPILERGAAADLNARNPEKAAQKFAALAYAQLLRQQKGAAVTAADKALANDNSVKIRFLAGRIFADAGDMKRAEAVIAQLSSEIYAEPQAYSKILQGVLALNRGEAQPAVKLLLEANALLDTWIGRFDIGRAYLAAQMLPQADSEFDRCIQRRGEALALFLDEEPTYAFFPPVYYYRGRVREAMNLAGFADSYRAYLTIRGKSTEDTVLPDVRRRAGAAQ